MKTRCYLDYNASAPLEPEAKEALISNFSIFANPSSDHSEGRKAKAILERARRNIAIILDVKPSNIVFTSGASEAAATLLSPAYRIGSRDVHMSHLYVSAAEHQAILSGGRFALPDISLLPLLPSGLVNIETLELKLAQHDQTKGMPLVAIQAANSETGALQPIKDFADIVHKYNGLLVVDAVQYLGKAGMDLTTLGGDFSIISAHKIGGPKNIGAFICHSDIMTPAPLIKGTQENGLRGGTQAIALCASFAAALEKRHFLLTQSNYLSQIESLRDSFEVGLAALDKKVIIYSKDINRLNNTSFFSLPNIDAQILHIALDLAGYAVSRGSACSSGRVQKSAILKAMQQDNPTGDSTGAIRVSIGPQTSKEDLAALLAEINKFYLIKSY